MRTCIGHTNVNSRSFQEGLMAKRYEIEVFNAQPLEIRAGSLDSALDKAKAVATALGLIIIGARLMEVLA